MGSRFEVLLSFGCKLRLPACATEPMRSTMKSPKLAAVLLLTEVVQICADGMSALFVVGTPPSMPLYADEPYKAHLEKQGYSVVLVKDTDVTEDDCQSHDIML